MWQRRLCIICSFLSRSSVFLVLEVLFFGLFFQYEVNVCFISKEKVCFDEGWRLVEYFWNLGEDVSGEFEIVMLFDVLVNVVFSFLQEVGLDVEQVVICVVEVINFDIIVVMMFDGMFEIVMLFDVFLLYVLFEVGDNQVGEGQDVLQLMIVIWLRVLSLIWCLLLVLMNWLMLCLVFCRKWGWMLSRLLFVRLYRDWETDRKSTRLNSIHEIPSRMPSSA